MEKKNDALFGRQNYLWMAIGGVVCILGILLMAGGKSSDPKVFSDSQVYGTTRITIAPILIVLGLMIEVYAIMKRPKTD